MLLEATAAVNADAPAMIDNRLFPATSMPDQDWWHALWPDPEAVLRDTGMQPGMYGVDLCCGDGHFTGPMCRLLQPGRVWAIDLDAGLLEQTRQQCQHLPNFSAVLGDARELPRLVSEPLDFVLIANTFHGVPDKAGLSRAVHSALKTGGYFAVINWYRRPREDTRVLNQPRGPETSLRMEPDEVRQIVEPMGFTLDKRIDVGPYHYAVVFAADRKP